MMGRLRIGLRYARAFAHVALAIGKVGLLWPLWTTARRRDEVQAWSRKALGIFGFKALVGDPRAKPAQRGALIVANHVSWLDIYALLAHADAQFVAKSDVRQWPAIGWLAQRLGTVFVERERRGTLPQCIATVADVLSSGRNVVLFPEGTTSEGDRLLPFHAPLFEVVIRADAVIQPVAIRYRRADGSPAAEAAFTGDMTLIGSFQRLAQFRDGTVEVAFLAPIAAAGQTRSALAAAAEQAIRDHLFGRRDSPEELVRVAA